MRNTRSLLGMPVISNGRKLGRVTCVLTDDSLRTVSGLYLSCGVAGSRFIECGQLDLFGDIAVLARSEGKRMQPTGTPIFRRALLPDGRHIGAITDALLSEHTLHIGALELSYGYLDDLTGGRARVRQYTVQKNGDVVVEATEGGNPT